MTRATDTSKASKRNGGSTDVPLEDIQRQFEALKNDMAALAASVGKLGAESKDAAVAAGADRLEGLADQGNAAVSESEKSLGRHLDDLMDTVRATPVKAIAISAGLGVLFGMMTARRR